MRHTAHAATASIFELGERNPKRINRWPRHVPQTRRTTCTNSSPHPAARLKIKLNGGVDIMTT
jgi:hypothetical protein